MKSDYQARVPPISEKVPSEFLDLTIQKEGFSEEFGARNLERAMDRLLGKKLADLLLAGGVAKGAVVEVGVEEGGIRLAVAGHSA